VSARGGITQPDLALLLLRLLVGASLVAFHGWAKITGGPERWEGIGGAMGNLGITFLPVVWGFLAAFSESVAAALVALGILARPAAAMVAFTMLVAAVHHLSLPAGEPGSGWKAASHALELCTVYTALLITGPGRYRVLFGR